MLVLGMALALAVAGGGALAFAADSAAAVQRTIETWVARAVCLPVVTLGRASWALGVSTYAQPPRVTTCGVLSLLPRVTTYDVYVRALIRMTKSDIVRPRYSEMKFERSSY